MEIFLEEITDTDDIAAIDTGGIGKKFELIMLKAFSLAGLDFTANAKNGKGWDFIPTGKDWLKSITGKNVNIKVATTKWLFGDATIGNSVAWDDYEPKKENEIKTKIKKLFTKNKARKLFFLRPKNKEIQQEIIDATKDKDVKKLKKILIKKNFGISNLGNKFEIKLLTKGNRINSITISKDGRIFMRAERPRRVGNSDKFVAFKKDSVPKPNPARKLITKSECLMSRLEVFTN